MADDVGRNPGLDDPFEKDERIKVVHIVPVYDHVDQFIGQDCGNYKARDGDDYRLGQAVNHREDAGVPLLRRLSNFPCDSKVLDIDFCGAALALLLALNQATLSNSVNRDTALLWPQHIASIASSNMK